jgi:hypothetical protein
MQIQSKNPQALHAWYPKDDLTGFSGDMTGLESVNTTLAGAYLSMSFDTVGNLQRYVDDKNPPGTGAWKRIAYLLREAQSDQYIKGSPGAIDFLRMMESIADMTFGDHTPDQILEPLFAKFKSNTAKRIRQVRTDNGSAKVKAKALDLYDAKQWKSVAAAGRGIFDDVQKYAKSLEPAQVLSQDRFDKTLREWLKNRDT